MKKILTCCILVTLFFSCKKNITHKATDTASNEALSTVSTNDLKVIPFVTIGTQIWMQSNLAITKYRNGDPIPYVPYIKGNKHGQPLHQAHGVIIITTPQLHSNMVYYITAMQ